MKHHFADLLSRKSEYWTITPNKERWAYRFDDLLDAPSNTSILTLTKNDLNWERVFDFDVLVELTLHEPSKEQIDALTKIEGIKSLRITHARPHALDFISGQYELEQLVLEYVSNFDDLSPVQELPSLKALHLENLRGVKNFSGLEGCKELRNLSIYGTTDWNQPIESLKFLNCLPKLECFGAVWVNFLSEFPIFETLSSINPLQEINIGMSDTTLENFAYLEAHFPNIIGAKQLPYRIIDERNQKIEISDYRGRITLDEFKSLQHAHVTEDGGRFIYYPPSVIFLGKGTRIYSGPIEKVTQKCEDYKAKYDALVHSYSSARP